MHLIAQKQLLPVDKPINRVKIRRCNINLTEQVALWLEGDDTLGAKIFAYGVFAATGLVITGALLRCLL